MRSICLLVPVVVLGLVIGCVGDDPVAATVDPGPDAAFDALKINPEAGPPSSPTIAAAATPASISVLPSKTVTFDVAVTRGGGFAGAVTVKLSGLPGGVTADPITIAANETKGTVTVVAGDAPSQGVASLGIAAQSADGSVGAKASIELVVRGLPGTLDPSFAGTGVVADASLLIQAVAMQKDGKIVLGGSAPAAGPFADNYGAVRLTPDGKLDATFGTAGLFKATLGFSQPGKTFVQSIAIDDAGNISLAGSAVSGPSKLGLVRLDATGKIDPTLALNGIGPSLATGRRVRLFGGNAYIMGYASSAIGGSIVVGKVKANGFDTAYGTNGMATLAQYLQTRDALIQPDGKIILCGTAGAIGTDESAKVVRLTADGTIDATFATGGTYTYDLLNTNESATAMAFLDSGKILIVGSKDTTNEMYRTVLLTNGTIDNTYSANVTGPGGATGVLVQPDGAVVIVGNAANAYAWRLLKSGAPDPTFNGGTPAMVTGTTAFITSSTLDKYNRLLMTTATTVIRMWL